MIVGIAGEDDNLPARANRWQASGDWPLNDKTVVPGRRKLVSPRGIKFRQNNIRRCTPGKLAVAEIDNRGKVPRRRVFRRYLFKLVAYRTSVLTDSLFVARFKIYRL